MPSQSNFQDVVILNQDTLSIYGEQIVLGSSAGSKSIVFAQDAALASALHVVASNPTAARTIIFPDANGTVGLITMISAGAASMSNGQIVFSNSNGVAFGLNGSTITASYSQSTGPGAIQAGTQTATSGTVIFSNSNGISFGMSGTATVTASADYVRSISAGTTNATGNQIIFSNLNGVSFGANGATITASVAAGAAVVSGIGVSTGGNTAGNTGTTLGTIVFAGVGGVSLSQSTAAGSLATISISMTASTAPGGIAAGTQTATSGTVIFSNSNGFTFGMAGSATVTATYERRITAFSQWAEWDTNWSISHASFSMQKISMPMHLSATRAQLIMAMSGITNSSGALTIQMGIYTMAGSTASLASSGSGLVSWQSGTNSTVTTASSQYGGVSGTRYITLPANFSMTPGDYMIGIWLSTSNAGTWRIFGRNAVNLVGSYEGDADYWLDGTSVSSVGSVVASFNKTDVNYARTGIGALRQPGFILIGTH